MRGTLSLKTVTTAGTPVQVSTTNIRCSQITIQPLRGLGASTVAPTQNSGYIYLMNSSTAKGAASTNIVAALASGADAVMLRAEQINGFNLADFYLDADTSGDGAIISYA